MTAVLYKPRKEVPESGIRSQVKEDLSAAQWANAP
jgi:hypothetical protein